MYRIDNPSAVTSRPVPGPPGTPGYFTNGNPAAAQEATIVDDWWMNQVQEEILTVIEQAGIVPDKTSSSQLFEALNKLYLFSEDLGAIYLTIQTYREWEAPKLTANGPSAYTVAYNIAPPALADGMCHVIEFNVANGPAPTLNVNALGAKPLLYYAVGAWRPCPPNLVGPGQQQKVAYHLATDSYRLSGWKDTTGDYVPTGRTSARLGTILGLGQAVSRIDYAGLFVAYGTTYGQGNGSTTFNLPDLRGRTVAGADLGAGRLVAQIAGTLGAVGGIEQVQYTVSGSTPSQSVAGSTYVSGTAYTNGLQTHGRTYQGEAYAYMNPNGPIGCSIVEHTHEFYGNCTGNVSCDASGNISGWTSGASITGSTDMRTNLPPTIVANYAICL